MNLTASSLIFIYCENGATALNTLEQYSKTTSACIILLDLHILVMDGWEFLDKFQSIPKPVCNLQLYILSSSTDTADLERVKSYPFVQKFTPFLKRYPRNA
ncbi:hypothetical protein SAMN02745246_00911 [Leeuwenhoekiella marinoflava DSM 3653]|uniref:Response regulator receiver domain-containing protein n=2 Tax=Leeuwenhoekiella marinoflava TaxID=988 RepID=A0A4Q0PPL3_9FLAO|nr:hypothetical protein DSL99_764 [Leeuwenhoekiella marinoflava]SHE71654.1 hypothetical protein SAMN02745246_00911 [Leeuwenhoekiella marinoflava DSM 3653]